MVPMVKYVFNIFFDSKYFYKAGTKARIMLDGHCIHDGPIGINTNQIVMIFFKIHKSDTAIGREPTINRDANSSDEASSFF